MREERSVRDVRDKRRDVRRDNEKEEKEGEREKCRSVSAKGKVDYTVVCHSSQS